MLTKFTAFYHVNQFTTKIVKMLTMIINVKLTNVTCCINEY